VEVVPVPIQLIALDLDGTLLNRNDAISPRNRRAIKAAVHAGVRIVLVTGRGTDVPARLADELKLDLPAICAHGALQRLCADGCIPREAVLAIGDSPNVPMLRWAGVGIAMGNAPLAVRTAVERVTASCEHDGVATAIERYVLEAPLRRAFQSA
jgi:hydroxymethylpyrimidine pyrophosphatase-like HAD family hydrolase